MGAHTVSMRLQIVGNTAQEGLLTQVAAEHANHGTSLQVADMIENLVYFKSVSHRDFDGVRGSQGIE